MNRRGRGRPPREYRIRVRGERRAEVDYPKLARALLEYAAMQERADHATPTTLPKHVGVRKDNGTKDATTGGAQ